MFYAERKKNLQNHSVVVEVNKLSVAVFVENLNTMDAKFIEKALVELREDKARRVQSLEQFREWLAKHPFLSNVRQGENFFEVSPKSNLDFL